MNKLYNIKEISLELNLTKKQVYQRFYTMKEMPIKIGKLAFYNDFQVDKIRIKNNEIVYYIYESKMNKS